MKASHTFNLLDARRAISVTERQRYILRVRTLSRARRRGVCRAAREARFPGPEERRARQPRSAPHERRQVAADRAGHRGAAAEGAGRTGRRLRCAASATAWPSAASAPDWIRRVDLCLAAPARRLHSRASRRSQPDQAIERRGPALAAALDAEGQPSKALLGFAQSCGVDVGQLEKLETDKGAWFVWRTVKPGQPLAALLPEIVDEALKALPIPTPDALGRSRLQLRAPGALAGDAARRRDRRRRGARPDQRAQVARPPLHASATGACGRRRRLARCDARRQRAGRSGRAARSASASEIATGRCRHRAACRGWTMRLLDEMANLTEWPVAIACTFEREFLDVPPEALVTTMVTNQKFVPVFDADGKLTEHFIGIANIESKDPAEIRKGYERVIRPRFADAKFFWDEDLKTPLASYQEQLKNVTYQQALGSSVGQERARGRAGARRSPIGSASMRPQATRAASLAKCDLLTRMVGEFPELQGVMGRYYASHDGEPRGRGRGAGQLLPAAFRRRRDRRGQARPGAGRGRTAGYAGRHFRRRHEARRQQGSVRAAPRGAGSGAHADRRRPGARPARQFHRGAGAVARRRAGGGAQAGQGRQAAEPECRRAPRDPAATSWTTSCSIACAAITPSRASTTRSSRRCWRCSRRASPISIVACAPWSSSAACRKRPAWPRRTSASPTSCASRPRKPARRRSDARSIRPISRRTRNANWPRHWLQPGDDSAAALAAGDYAAVLARLAQLQAPVDAFFDSVLVNAEDPAVRANRLALLNQLKTQFSAVADIAVL